MTRAHVQIYALASNVLFLCMYLYLVTEFYIMQVNIYPVDGLRWTEIDCVVIKIFLLSKILSISQNLFIDNSSANVSIVLYKRKLKMWYVIILRWNHVLLSLACFLLSGIYKFMTLTFIQSCIDSPCMFVCLRVSVHILVSFSRPCTC